MMMLAKVATPDPLVIWNRDYAVVIYVYEVTYKISFCDSLFFVEVVSWQKFGNSSISTRDVVVTLFL